MEKLAIIGGGVAGLSAAYFLRNHYQVTVFERNGLLGGNNYGMPVEDQIRSPMGVIIYPREAIFPNTYQLIRELGVPLYMKTCQHVFKYQNAIQYNSRIGKFNPFHLIQSVKDLYFLLKQFSQEQMADEALTLQSLIDQKKLSADCVHYFVAPLASLYLSMRYQQILAMPLLILAKWWEVFCVPLRAHRQWHAVAGGCHGLIDALAEQSNAQLHNNAKIVSVKRQGSSVLVQFKAAQSRFDKVIFATRPDEALNLLSDPSSIEKQILSKFDTGEVMSVLHRKPYGCYKQAMTVQVMDSETRGQHVVTTWNQALHSQKEASEPYFVTLHEPGRHVIEQKDIHDEIKLRVPIATARTFRAALQVDKLNQQENQTYYCGSYFKPFFYHEQAITSAKKLADKLVKKTGNTETVIPEVV